MLTKLTIRLFKRFRLAEIELGNPVVFIGPNDSGKTSALQALSLWDTGLKRWYEKKGGSQSTAEKRVGVTINRRDLFALPIPDTRLLWFDQHLRNALREGGKTRTENVRIDVIVNGVTDGTAWSCGLEFDYANEEFFYCRPLRLDPAGSERMDVPAQAMDTFVAYLPPMSGLASTEERLDRGQLNVRIGEGRTAEVLRNLCFQLATAREGSAWFALIERMRELFGVTLVAPELIHERGQLTMKYSDRRGVELDLASSGRGMQQTLLVLSFMMLNPGAVLLLDEPDAHLEILRQRQIYQVLSETAQQYGSQIIAASHSEVIMNEAADRDVVVAFLGRPHRIDDRGPSQVLKSLKKIGFEQYYQAEQKGWVLYLEGSTDLAMLLSLARVLDHPAADDLRKPFVHYVFDQPNAARQHFYGLREAKGDLVGLALFDRIDSALQDRGHYREYSWTRREIENYIGFPEVLLRWAAASARRVAGEGTLFEQPEADTRLTAMQQAIERFAPRVALDDLNDPWWMNTKLSDDFLDRVFEFFFQEIGTENLLRKTDYHVLTEHIAASEIDSEVIQVLNMIHETALEARPVGLED